MLEVLKFRGLAVGLGLKGLEVYDLRDLGLRFQRCSEWDFWCGGLRVQDSTQG